MQALVQGEASFPSLVKAWRELRKCSQLSLALDAGVSQRHVSFLESGRSQPSRDMVLSLADAMDLPLRDRNQLLSAAGFAPVYSEKSLDDESMTAVKRAVGMTLKHHMPFPALAIDKHWNVLEANESMQALLSLLGDPEEVWQLVDPSGQQNLYRLTFHPQGLRAYMVNWSVISEHMLKRLYNETLADPMDQTLRDLFSEVSAWAGEISLAAEYSSEAAGPVLPLELSSNGLCLKLFSMVSSFGTAIDVTAYEMRIETFFQMDDTGPRSCF